MKPIYEIVRVTDEVVVIADMCNEYNSKSVTNAAEKVVAELLKEYGPNRRFFYFDSDGSCDELVHDGTRFQTFAFGKNAIKTLKEDTSWIQECQRMN